MTLKEFMVVVNEVLYYEYQIELYWVLFYNLDVVRLIEGIDKNILICYTLDTVKKGITKNEWNEYTKNWP